LRPVNEIILIRLDLSIFCAYYCNNGNASSVFVTISQNLLD
jgi:hypothetical protein